MKVLLPSAKDIVEFKTQLNKIKKAQGKGIFIRAYAPHALISHISFESDANEDNEEDGTVDDIEKIRPPQAGVLTSLEIIEEQDHLPFGSNSTKAKPKVHMLGSEDRSKVEGFICRRGSEFALKHLRNMFGSSLFEKLPKIWDCHT
ncbi:TATA-binding protein-associated factor BTAF1 [Tanacetum coccineum]